jgi:hypothetical protein
MRSALFSNSKLDIKYKYQACFRVQIDNESGVEWLFAKKGVSSKWTRCEHFSVNDFKMTRGSFKKICCKNWIHIISEVKTRL